MHFREDVLPFVVIEMLKNGYNFKLIDVAEARPQSSY